MFERVHHQRIAHVPRGLNWLERCMQAMAMNLPKALLWERIRALRRALP